MTPRVLAALEALRIPATDLDSLPASPKRCPLLAITTEAWFDGVLETPAGLSTSERDAVLQGTACSVYGRSSAD